jgi:hypothetical protein
MSYLWERSHFLNESIDYLRTALHISGFREADNHYQDILRTRIQQISQQFPGMAVLGRHERVQTRIHSKLGDEYDCYTGEKNGYQQNQPMILADKVSESSEERAGHVQLRILGWRLEILPGGHC